MAKPDDQTPPATPPSSGAPADTPPAGGVDLNALEALVRKVFDEKMAAGAPPAGGGQQPAGTPPAGGQPSTPPAGGSGSLAGAPHDLAAMVESAVSTALERRDSQDALAVLAEEIDSLKRAVTGRGERKAGWGRYLLGPGFNRG